MSQENVELVRSGYAASDPFTTFAESLPPESDFELHLPADYPEGEQVFRGREGINALTAGVAGVVERMAVCPGAIPRRG